MQIWTSTLRTTLILFAAVAGGLVACSPSLDWRETTSAEGKFAAAFPGKPQVSTREIPFGGARVSMTMTSAGKGPTLFGVGVAKLPAAAIASPDAIEATVNQFRDALLVNSGTMLFTVDDALPLAAQARTSARGVTSVRAQRHPAATAKKGSIAQLAAHFFVVEDRLYQVAALADADLGATDLETFFTSFKLIP